MEIQDELIRLRDEKNAAFLAKLVPNVPPETVFGARMPELRKLAKRLRGTAEAARFLAALPHASLDENQLHALLLNELRDYDDTLRALAAFLPRVDNWAVCDALRPKCFVKNHAALLAEIPRWLDDDWPYTRRFGLEMLMTHFLAADFSPEQLDWAARTRAEDYYVRMMQAWYFATALAGQYEATLPVLTERRLEPWTHNKTIQKACESLRIPAERKTCLKTLRV